MIIKKFIEYLLMYIFSSISISFKNLLRNFNENVLLLDFAFDAVVDFVGSDAIPGSTTGPFATSGYVAGSGVSSRPGILSK